MARVVLAMSGGVDSSVAAYLLLQQGFEVVGVFMRHGEEALAACDIEAAGSSSLPIVPAPRAHKQGCCTAADAEDARRVADGFEIPFYALNLQSEFRQIIDYFVDEYQSGRTPNPCVMCNNWIKFGKLFDYADSVGAEFVATGHYARLAGDGIPELRRGIDEGKDQSYVLFGIDRAYLPRMLLPVGDYRKSHIRRLASEQGLRVADKQDSQEICFVTNGKHDEFIRTRSLSRDTSGEIVGTDGRVLGRHAGIEGFTIGQRKGLGVAVGEPRFVVRIDGQTGTVVVGRRDELERSQLTANRVNWLVDPAAGPFRCQCQIRYNSRPAQAIATVLHDSRLRVEFDEPILGVAPGQAVVCYEHDRVLGGGWIE